MKFTFVYQFYSRRTTPVESTFWNPVGLFSFMYILRYILLLSLLRYSKLAFELITFNHLIYHFTFHFSCKYSSMIVNLPVWNGNELENKKRKGVGAPYPVWFPFHLNFNICSKFIPPVHNAFELEWKLKWYQFSCHLSGLQERQN